MTLPLRNPRPSIVWLLLMVAPCLLAYHYAKAEDGDARLVAASGRRLLAGSELDFPPFALVKPNGEADGFTVDLLKAVAREMHLNVAIKVGPFGELKREFDTGQLDILPNLAHSEERDRIADFSVPHVVTKGAIFVRKGDRRITSEKDLSDKAIIVLDGDLPHNYAVAQGWGKPLVTTKTAADAFRLLSSGQHDCVLLSKLVGLITLHDLNIDNIEAIRPPIEGITQKFGFAVHAGDADLLAMLNEGLAIVKAKGLYDQLYEKWFGILEPQGFSPEEVMHYVRLGVGTLLAIVLGSALWQFSLRRQLKKRTLELRERETMMTSIVENLPAMVFVKDHKELKFVQINKAAEGMLGYTREEMLGKSDHELFPADEANFFVEKDRAVLRSGQLLDIPEEPIETKDRGRRILHTKKLLIPDERGRPLFLLGISEDITERKRAEEQLRSMNAALLTANRELEAFSYTVSHDLRAPLRHITGFVNVLGEHLGETLDETGRRYLRTISQAAMHMAQLIDNLLAFARLGRAELRKAPVDVNRLVDEVLDGFRDNPRTPAILWKKSTLPIVHGDPTLLRQVLENLLDNAVKYTRTREQPRIEIGWMTNRVDHQEEIVIFVRDNGVGFDMRYVQHLFGVFQRLHRNEEFEGTGIGLASVRLIIHRHGGRVWAEGEVGKGATFFFSLPVVNQPWEAATDSISASISAQA